MSVWNLLLCFYDVCRPQAFAVLLVMVTFQPEALSDMSMLEVGKEH